MSRIFITGSAGGLGLMAAKLLIDEGHQVVLHGRNTLRAKEAMALAPGAETALGADLSSIAETKQLAAAINALGKFDAIIHNAAVGYKEPARGNTVDGLPPVFAANSLAPYILTCLIERPRRLIYLSSALHHQGNTEMNDLLWNERSWNGYSAYSDTKLHDLLLALAVARRWKGTYSSAVEPGWVATKMGGAGATDSLKDGPVTQAWLAVSPYTESMTTGRYFYHQQPKPFLEAAADPALQDEFLAACAKISGVQFPA